MSTICSRLADCCSDRIPWCAGRVAMGAPFMVGCCRVATRPAPRLRAAGAVQLGAMANELSNRRVAIVATDGVEQVELDEPRRALEEAGATVEIVSLKAGEFQ